MFVLQNDKAENYLNANFGLFTIDGNKMIRNGHGHHFSVHSHTGHAEIVSINS